jgi:hypothetical protein
MQNTIIASATFLGLSYVFIESLKITNDSYEKHPYNSVTLLINSAPLLGSGIAIAVMSIDALHKCINS